MRAPRSLPVVASLVLLASPSSTLAGSRSAPGEAPVPRLAAGGVDLTGLDRSIAPGDDFFSFANGSWLKATPIPPDRSSFGVSAELAEQASRRTRELIQEAAATPGDEDARKVGDYYASVMDEQGIEAKGLLPLEPALARIAAISDRRSLARVLGAGLRADVDPLNATNLHTDHVLGLWVAQDLGDPARPTPYLLQGGLGMPDREYYLADGQRMAELRARYQAHIAAMLRLAGRSEAEAKAARVFDLERRIALAHWSLLDSEDVAKANNPWKREDFAARAAGLDWTEFFGAAGLQDQARFIVWQPSAVTGIAALLGSEPLGVLKDYLAFHALDHYGGLLPKAFVEERFDFYGRTLAGVPELKERWKSAVDRTSGALGEAVGRLYAERHFPPAAKARLEQMVQQLVQAFRRRIDALPWMSRQTKAKAQEKLTTLYVGIGYPDRPRDYAGLEIRRGDALGNLERAERFEYRRNLAKLGRPVDRREWALTAQTVNAVNLPLQNALNFPAAILQPPFFDPAADAAANYGSIGSVIGHEISHSFDDQGSQFDAAGRLVNWWGADDLAHFKAAAAELVAQYDAYRPFPDAPVNGRATLSENIADVAGLAAAHDAYRLSLAGRPAPSRDGLSGDQQFFLSFAQGWREKLREPALRQQLLTDGHAPAQYRAAAVRNIDAWYEAFAVEPGQALYLAPERRIRVW